MLDKGLELSDEKIFQLKEEIARLNPSPDQLRQMHDRFIRNNNFADFALYRFIDGAIPLYTERQMEDFVDKKIARLLDDARQQSISYLYQHGRIAYGKELLFTRELVMDLTAGLSKVMEQRKEKERELIKHRIYAVKAWLRAADDNAIKEAFILSGAVNFYQIGSIWNVKQFGKHYNVCKGDLPTPVSHWPDRKQAEAERTRLRDADRAAFPQESFIRDAKQYGLHHEILFDTVEQLMRRLPCQSEGCTDGSAPTANSS